jgi:hypothetical protein
MALDTAASKPATNTNGDGASAEDENKKKTGAGADKSQETAEAEEQPSLGASVIADPGAIKDLKLMVGTQVAGAEAAVQPLVLTDQQKEEKEKLALAATKPAEENSGWFSSVWDSIGSFFGKKTEKQEQVEKDVPKPADATVKPTEQTTATPAEDEEAFDWFGLGEKFDSFFGNGKEEDEGEKKLFTSKNNETGESSTTEIGDCAVRNRTLDKDGKPLNDTRVDGTGAVDTNGQGDTAVWNRETGEHRSRFHDGSEAGYNPETGQHTHRDTQGREVEMDRTGVWRYSPRDGEVMERGEARFRVGPRNGHRTPVTVQGAEKPQEIDDEGKPDVPGTEQQPALPDGVTSYVDRRGVQHFVIKEEDGLSTDVAKDGRVRLWGKDEDGRDIWIRSHKDNPDEMQVVINRKDHLSMRRNAETNSWDVVDRSGKVIGTGENGEIKLLDGTVLARIKLDGNTITARNAQINTNGEVVVNTANGDRITTDGTTTQIQNPAGVTTDVVTNTGTGTTIENKGANGTGPAPGVVSEVVEIAADGQGTIVENKADGTQQKILTFDTTPAPGENVLEVHGGPDGQGVVYKEDPKGGGIQATYENGDIAHADGTLERSNGVTFHSNGDVTFPDGTRVDSYGNVTDRDGNAMGSAGDWEGSAADGGTQARINAAISVAKDLASKPNPSPGDIAYLLSLLGSLGSAKADAIKSGDAGTFFAADLAQATVSANISDLQAKIGQQSMMQMMASIPPSLAAQLSNESGTHDAHAIRQMLENHGVHTSGGR